MKRHFEKIERPTTWKFRVRKVCPNCKRRFESNHQNRYKCYECSPPNNRGKRRTVQQ